MVLQEFLSNHSLESFCYTYHIRLLSYFGSEIRDDFSPQSDIDVLVDFEPGFTPGFDFFLIEEELSQLLGRRVDLQTINVLSPEIRSSVLAEAVPAYEQKKTLKSRLSKSSPMLEKQLRSAREERV